MPLDVIMPALGMAQDTGHIVAWHKKPGDEVAEGDILFEVETDKATMEVAADGAGYLTDVTAGEGDDVPVGNVIARISDSAEGSGEAPPAKAAAPAEASGDAGGDDLPEGHNVIMPTLGMAQDTGLLVAWHVSPGDTVAEGDILFEVETDKSTMEVAADAGGHVAALLAEEGEEVPTGQTIAILTADAPAKTIRRSAKEAAAPAPKAEPAARPAEAPKAEAPKPAPAKPAAPKGDHGRILASPKLRRLALEKGLDLGLLADAGVPQPYHVKDLDRLEELARSAPAAATGGVPGAASRRLTATVEGTAFAGFASWLAETGEVSETAALAGFAAASLGLPATVAVERTSGTQTFSVPSDRLGEIAPAEDDSAAGIVLRDLRATPIGGVELGPEDVPVLTLTRAPGGLALTLEARADHMTPAQAIQCLAGFAARLEDPLRHLL